MCTQIEPQYFKWGLWLPPYDEASRFDVPWIKFKDKKCLVLSLARNKVQASRLYSLLYVCEALCLREDELRSFATEHGIKYRSEINGKFLL